MYIFIVYIIFLLTATEHEDSQGISLKMKWKIFKAITTQKTEIVNPRNKLKVIFIVFRLIFM